MLWPSPFRAMGGTGKWGWGGNAGSAQSPLPLGRSSPMRRGGKQGASGRRSSGLVTGCLGQASREMGFVGETAVKKGMGRRCWAFCQS